MAKGHENLIPLNKRSKEAQRKIQSMGGKACREKTRAKQNIIAVSFRGLSSAYTRPLGRRSNNSGNSVKM